MRKEGRRGKERRIRRGGIMGVYRERERGKWGDECNEMMMRYEK